MQFKRFNELKKEDINFDFHFHTNYTDGESSPEEMVEKALELKLEAITFSEHVNKKSTWFTEFGNRINSLKEKYDNQIKILLGIEAKITDFTGELDTTKNMVKRVDLVIGVIHRYPDGNGGSIPIQKIGNMDKEKAGAMEFKLTMKILENQMVDVLGHPFGVYSGFFNNPSPSNMRTILRKAVNNNKVVEINTKYLLNFNKEIFFSLLKEINPLVSIGSDAHHKDEIARNFEIIKEYIEKWALM